MVPPLELWAAAEEPAPPEDEEERTTPPGDWLSSGVVEVQARQTNAAVRAKKAERVSMGHPEVWRG